MQNGQKILKNLNEESVSLAALLDGEAAQPSLRDLISLGEDMQAAAKSAAPVYSADTLALRKLTSTPGGAKALAEYLKLHKISASVKSFMSLKKYSKMRTSALKEIRAHKAAPAKAGKKPGFFSKVFHGAEAAGKAVYGGVKRAGKAVETTATSNAAKLFALSQKVGLKTGFQKDYEAKLSDSKNYDALLTAIDAQKKALATATASGKGLMATIRPPFRTVCWSVSSRRAWFDPGLWPKISTRSELTKSSNCTVPFPEPSTCCRAIPDGS